MKTKSPALRISMIAILTAVVTVFTLIVKVPTGKGYLHLGDVAICFVSFTLGPITGLICGGLGTALADIIGGYASWAAISFFVHGLEGFLVAFLVRGESVSFARKLIAGLVAIITVAGGYYLLSGLFLTGFEAALAEIPGNIGQAAVGVVLGLAVSEAVKKAYPPIKDMAW
jgi:Predicted membrane protein